MIRAFQVRVIDQHGGQVGILNTRDAVIMAKEANLDLIEISPTATPPVCRIGDFGKYKYELTKKQKDAKKKQHVVHLKELKMHPKTEEHDYGYRLKHAREFLTEGDRVKITVAFKGREMAYLDFGRRILDKAANDLTDIADIEINAQMEGRNMFSIFTVKKNVLQKIRTEKERKRRLEEKARMEAERKAGVVSVEKPEETEVEVVEEIFEDATVEVAENEKNEE